MKNSRSKLIGWLLVLFVLSQAGIVFGFFSRHLEWEFQLQRGRHILKKNQKDHYETAEHALRRSLELADSFEHPGRRAVSLYWLGNLHLRKREIAPAYKKFEASLEAQLKVVGEEDLLVGVLRTQMGLLDWRHRNYLEGEKHTRLAIKAFERQAPLDYVPRLHAEGVLGFSLASQGRLEEAQPHLKFALKEINALEKPPQDLLNWRGRLKQFIVQYRRQKELEKPKKP